MNNVYCKSYMFIEAFDAKSYPCINTVSANSNSLYIDSYEDRFIWSNSIDEFVAISFASMDALRAQSSTIISH